MRGYSKALNRFAIIVACSTFFLIIAGGYVTSTQSGLSVPDWPNTYGHFMFSFPLDQMVGGIFYEHSHRLIASVVGFLTVILAFWLWKKDDRKWVRVLGFVALGSVITQGILGGLTVLFFLPTAISVSHATLAQSFFGIVASIALFTSKWWRDEQPKLKDSSNNLTRLTMFTTAAIFIQLILGALMRHSEAGLAVPDFPFAYGQWLPSFSPEAMRTYNEYLESIGLRIFADEPITASQVLVHMLHRVWAFVVAGLAIWTAFQLQKHAVKSKRLSRLSLLLFVLILIQITLGAFTVLSQKAIDVTTAHVATGALLLIISVLTTLHTVKLFGFSEKKHVAYSFKTKEVTA
ncbi:MAG: COX15/CtaA family protein [Ignavibacteriae bacterium]|nr:COX15/CtaA family protein [Ignavibacteriota bacterium]